MRTLLVTGSVIAGLALSTGTASAATVCASADSAPTAVSAGKLERAAFCLVNQERTRRGLKAFRWNKRLALAGRRHAKDMVSREYFSHDAPGGVSFVDRIRRTGYASGSFPSLGEDLAWGSGTLGSARAIVQGWMNSPGHRANILRRSFREAGLGVAVGAPGTATPGATYALEFGSGGKR